MSGEFKEANGIYNILSNAVKLLSAAHPKKEELGGKNQEIIDFAKDRFVKVKSGEEKYFNESTEETLVHHFARNNELGKLKALPETYPLQDWINSIDKYGYTPLALAVTAKNYAVNFVQYLLEHGADPDIPGHINPLIYSLEAARWDVAALLFANSQKKQDSFETLLFEYKEGVKEAISLGLEKNPNFKVIAEDSELVGLIKEVASSNLE